MANADFDIAMEYLLPPADSFWRWDKQGQVACWSSDGRTIAFRAELETVLAEIASPQLPPIGAVLLFMAACLPTWSRADREPALRRCLAGSTDWNSLIRSYGRHALDPDLLKSQDRVDRPLSGHLDKVLAAMDRLHNLSPALRLGTTNKAQLARLLFEPVRVRADAATATAVLRTLGEGIPGEALAGPDARHVATAVSHLAAGDTVMALYQGLCLYPLTDERLSLMREVGLEALPAPAEVELPPARMAANLIREIRDDEELRGMARVASHLIAVVHLPRSVSDSEQLPIGGLSDITNRGQLDRLLPGELAHDDLTLAVRIALNEALYYRREAPPRNPIGRRRILIDVGIRLWGVPRVYAAAVALAMAATAPDTVGVAAFRATPRSAVPVNLLTREGLVEMLAALEIQTHPGKALQELASDDHEEDDDLVVVTHARAAADTAFAQALAACDRSVYVAAIDEDGGYALWLHSGKGRRLLREAQLDLSAILTDSQKPRIALVDDDADDADATLPAIFRARPFPLLLPHHVRWKNTAWREEIGLLALVKDRRLMLWSDRNCGARQLTDRVPVGLLIWMGFLDERTAGLLIRCGSTLTLLLVDISNGATSTREVAPPPDLLGATLVGGQLALIGTRNLLLLDAWTGSRIDVGQLPAGVSWSQNGRLFHRGSHWTALHWDGATMRLQDVDVQNRPNALLRTVFEREGMDGLWSLWGDGTVESLATGATIQLTSKSLASLVVLGVSRDGHRLVIRRPGGSGTDHQPIAVDLLHRKESPLLSDDSRGERFLATADPNLAVSHRSVWQKIGKFQQVSVGFNGDVPTILLAESSGCVRLAAEPHHGLVIMRVGVPPKLPSRRPFASYSGKQKFGYTLKYARWPSGDKLWLDSRGLIHLQPADAQMPGSSFVLCAHSQTGGWASDGTLAGFPYFTGNNQTGLFHDLNAHVADFVRRVE